MGYLPVAKMDTQIDALLRRLSDGDSSAQSELIPLIYPELRRIAGRYLRRERKDHTLQPTALVNEAYLRIFENTTPRVNDKAHFLAITSQMMRRILVDYARARSTEKRGGELCRVEITGEAFAGEAAQFLPLLELDRALDDLAKESQVLAQAIEMRYFGGLTAEEAASATGRSVHEVRHDLRFAQAWLRRALAGL